MGVTSRRSSFNSRNFCECSKEWHHANESLRTFATKLRDLHLKILLERPCMRQVQREANDFEVEVLTPHILSTFK